MTLFYIPNSTQHLNLTTTLLTIIKEFTGAKVIVNDLLMARIVP